MAGSATVDITLTADTTKAEQGFESAAAAAGKLGSAVDDAGAKVDTGASRIAGAADAADALDSKSAAATGALGALSSGFELIGAEGAAQGLQSAAMATDFFSGAGQAANLVLQTQAGLWIKNAAATIKNTVATTAQSVATKAAAAAQWLLNAALNANPIGLVIAAVALLVGGFVLLYKKSDTFRDLMDALWAGMKKAINVVANVLEDVLGAAFTVVKVYVQTWWAVVSTIFNLVKNAVEAVAGKLSQLQVPGAVKTVLDGIKSAVDSIISAVQTLIGWLGKIKIPKIPSWVPGVGRAAPEAAAAGVAFAGVGRYASPGIPTRGTTMSTSSAVTINVTGALDPEAVARQIRRLLDGHDRRVGLAS